MLFTSLRFFLFAAAVVLVLGALSGSRGKKWILALASCFFYASWDWRCLGFLLAISVSGWVCGLRMRKAETPARRRTWLLWNIAVCLSTLGWFKYLDFFSREADSLLKGMGIALPHLSIPLPVGLSFYVFTCIGYAIDVFRGELEPRAHFLDCFNFMGFFPSVVSGPILRGPNFIPQIEGDFGPSKERLLIGASIFLQGFTKKTLVANRLDGIASPIFEDPAIYSTPTVWCGLLAYALQLYCDFSGYSDMAIGVAKMLGLNLPENFNMPYISTSIGEFWRRWHISLSTWFRDYVFLPLAFTTARKLAWFRLSAGAETMVGYCTGILITMLLCGIWHGTGWNFVLWGGIHGLGLCVQRLWMQARRRKAKMPGWLGWSLTQLIVLLAWVPFRATSHGSMLLFLKKLAGIGGGGALWFPEWLLILLPLVFMGHWIGISLEHEARGKTNGRGILRVADWMGWSAFQGESPGCYLRMERVTVFSAYVVALWIMSVFLFSPTMVSPFVYFRF